jgi:hypothetical protein
LKKKPGVPETAWSLLHQQAIAFVPTTLAKTLGVVDKGGERNALDDFCNPIGVVVTRRCQ